MPPTDRLRRKLTVRAEGRTLVLVKRPEESGAHVVQKALLWLRHLPAYPGLRVEQSLPFPSRYKPDLYALADGGEPPSVAFWGECGTVSADKLRALLRAHPGTHFVFSKWGVRLAPFAAQIDEALDGQRRRGLVELVAFPVDAEGWLDEPVEALPSRFAALERRTWAAPSPPVGRRTNS